MTESADTNRRDGFTAAKSREGTCDQCEREGVPVVTLADEYGTTLCAECVKACEGQVSYGLE